MLDKEFEAYQTYDWGVDPKVLQPIDEAIVASHGNAATRKELEGRIAAVLGSEAPRAAKDYACRQLRTIGTAASVPVLAGLLTDAELSHMARYALERIPDAAAAAALRDGLAKTSGKLKVGVVGSLGVRGEAESVEPLMKLLGDPDGAVAIAAAHALGRIGSPEAGSALVAAKANPGTKDAMCDALLMCAENLLKAGNKGAAKAAYQGLLGGEPSPPVKQAAELGVRACGG